ncbi:MAG TPA: glycosyltransferase family 2 protein [Gemmatimonadales bacterium]|nr:glycosyltransferase family 2 protein [Gemmatimonadales bacterium]
MPETPSSSTESLEEGVELSVVVPLYNEEENVPHLVAAIAEALEAHSSWELVLVDDGSRDGTVAQVLEAASTDSRIRLVELARNYGQTQAMQAGFDHSRGNVVVTMDGDLQNDPRDIPLLLETLDQGYDLVTGYRKGRQDAVITRKVPSYVANRLIAALTGVKVRDNGCSLKAYRRSVLQQLNLYSDMHRFLPALAAASAAARITEVPVRHHARRFGESKYGLSRIAKIAADLMTIKMISSFRETPLALFVFASIVPLLTSAVVGASWLHRWMLNLGEHREVVTMPAVALILFALAAYLVMLGLLAEVALAESRMPVARRLPR